MEEIYAITPTAADTADRDQQRRIIWLFSMAFVCVNVITIFGGFMSAELAQNVLLMSDVIFWFNMSILGIIGSYFGIDIVANIVSNKTAMLTKVNK